MKGKQRLLLRAQVTIGVMRRELCVEVERAPPSPTEYLWTGFRDPERTEFWGASRTPSGSYLNLGASLSGVLHVEQSNGKRSLFQRWSEREREGKRVEPRPGGTQSINKALAQGLHHSRRH